MSELPTIEDRVSKGIGWLEERGAYDWAEKIVAAVDESRFHMARCDQCAVGVTLGDFYKSFSDPLEEDGLTYHEACDEACDRGFLTYDDTWADLEAEWERRAREHADYRAEVLG